MTSRRAAAFVLVGLLAAGCGSVSGQRHAHLPTSGPPGVVRIALAHVLWPLDPAHAHGRDETALARVLFSTPLRTDPESGALRPGLCSKWGSANDAHVWRFRCRHAPAIAAALRRASLFASAKRIEAPDERTVVVSLRKAVKDLPYAMTAVAAAPPGVPGPFRLISASPRRVVAERRGLRLEFQRLEPYAALRLFRRGRLDEAPVPLGDIRAVERDPELQDAVRVRGLLAVDLVVFDRDGSLARLPELRRAYDQTADRADYQALVPEFEAPPAESLAARAAPNARAAALKARQGRRRIRSLPKVAVRFAPQADPDLDYGLNLLVASWRDLGLGAVVGGRPDARFERLLAPYPRLHALQDAVRGEQIVPIAWVADARLVSPRLRGWREDELGAVDYTRIRVLRP